MKERKQYNPHIEVLRITAIIALVLYHLACMSHGETLIGKLFFFIGDRGWMGTDVFLVLAGFYFYQSYHRSPEGTPLSCLKGRAKRIVPSYYLFLILYLTIGLLVERKAGNNFFLPKGYWIYFFTFTANIPMALGHWSGVALEGLFALSLLVQLYLLFAVFFVMIKKRKNLLLFLIALEVLMILARFLPPLRNKAWFSYFFTLTRMDGFIFGIILACLREDPRTQEILEKRKTALVWISGLLLLATVPFTDALQVGHSWTSCLSFPFIGLFFASLVNHILTRDVKMPSFYAGDFVYSLYLVKLPLIYLCYRLPLLVRLDRDAPVLFSLAALTVCLVWGLTLHSIHYQRRRIMQRITS